MKNVMMSIILGSLLFTALPVMADGDAPDGLLFYLSGDNGGFTADHARGMAEPTFLYDVKNTPDGARGNGFECGNKQLFAFDAPGNIYSQRGTLAFFWRSRMPVGEAPFPVFRVGYSDHSSWDLVWLRIDWNGSGFEAFVTDANLARPRVKHTLPNRPASDQWIHIALSWDETKGIRFYLDGKQVARKDTAAVFYAGLDQFGPHSRIISPYQVQSLYNYERGGDIDEISIFDSMISDRDIAQLANGTSPMTIRREPVVRSIASGFYRDEWQFRYGWNRSGDIPPYLEAPTTVVRKVEIHDVYDLKQWVWKGTDGIRETTWPYVYNRSRIPGRNDYFQLPDWNCYSLSGKKVTFFMPEEPWNHIEISGAAYGEMSLLRFDKERQKNTETPLASRSIGQERTFHRLNTPVRGGKIRFENVAQETPIGEFMAYNVTSGSVPVGTSNLTYRLNGNAEPDNVTLTSLVDYIDGRFTPDERSIMVALPGGAPRHNKEWSPESPLPIVHVLVPFEFRKGNLHGAYTRYSYTWENIYGGLDGIALDLPALNITPTHDGLIPMNVTVHDPIWPDRALLDFTFSVKPGEARTLFLDTRDRVLPNGYSLYLTIASASGEFGTDDLEGANLRLVFKDRKEAIKEQEVDRFTQVKDNVGNMVEEHPNIKKLRMYNRFSEDITDLFRVNPDHKPGRFYWSIKNGEQGWPSFEQPKAPAGTPLWAFRQIENLKLVKKFILWWTDERRIANGEYGGGLSDDSDMSNYWIGPALMGIEPDKLTEAVLGVMEACYNDNMFDGGLNRIITDELHVYEEGVNVIPQTMLLDYADPKVVERLMTTAKEFDRITGINDLGERQVISTFYGGSKIFSESVWAKAKTHYSYLIIQPGLSLVEYNGHPATKKLLLEIADGLLAHRKKDANGNYHLPQEIFFPSGEDWGRGLGTTVHLFYGAYRWTGDEKYLLPILDYTNRGSYGVLNSLNANLTDLLGKREEWGPDFLRQVTPQSGSDYYRHMAWRVSGNKQFLEEYYADQIQTASQRMYMYTDGHWWSDRVNINSKELQRSRLGGVALTRSALYPGHSVSWKFKAPSNEESVAILINNDTTEKMTIIAHNLDQVPVTAEMTAWDIEPGSWEVVQGVDNDGDDIPDGETSKKRVNLERTGTLELTFPARKTSVITLRRRSKAKAYWKRPDLGIGNDDIAVRGNSVAVTVHSLGSVKAPASSVSLIDHDGKVISTSDVPSLDAPLDFAPKTAAVTLTASSGVKLSGCSVVIDKGGKLLEITERNNTVVIP
ncbi:LamG-like jellyroll fold domain-containing protein [Candidatus Latescibacterota bacterium]